MKKPKPIVITPFHSAYPYKITEWVSYPEGHVRVIKVVGEWVFLEFTEMKPDKDDETFKAKISQCKSDNLCVDCAKNSAVLCIDCHHKAIEEQVK
jgi:hypothetical protein